MSGKVLAHFHDTCSWFRRSRVLNCVSIQPAEKIAARRPKVRQAMAWVRHETKVSGAGVVGFSAHLPDGQAAAGKGPDQAIAHAAPPFTVSMAARIFR